MFEKFTDPTIHQKQDEPPATGADIGQPSDDSKATQDKERNESIGDRYFNQHFHPHSELPEEMPETIKNYLEEKSIPADIWPLIRSGLGNVACPDGTWDEISEYFNTYGQGGDMSSPRGEGGDYQHLFTNLATLWGMFRQTSQRMVNVIETKDEETRKISYDPNAARDRLNELMDDSKNVITECENISQAIDNAKKVVSESTEEEKKAKRAEINQLRKDLDLAVDEIESNPLDSDVLNKAIEIAKINQSLEGHPWYAQFAIRRVEAINALIRPLLSRTDQILYDEIATPTIPRIHEFYYLSDKVPFEMIGNNWKRTVESISGSL